MYKKLKATRLTRSECSTVNIIYIYLYMIIEMLRAFNNSRFYSYFKNDAKLKLYPVYCIVGRVKVIGIYS